MPNAPMTAGPAPLNVAEILDPEWLQAHAYRDVPGVRVLGAREVWRQENTATKVRIAVDLDGPDTAVRAICVKGMLDESGQKWLGNGNSITETRFYRDLAPALRTAGVRVPPCLYTGIDKRSGHGLIVMEDLVAAGAEFLTALTPYSPNQARQSLAQLARLHSITGPGTPAYATRFDGITLRTMAKESLIPLPLLQEQLDGPRGAPLPDAIRDAGRLHAALAPLVERFAGEEACLVHGDAHAGNLYRQDGDAGVIDWQIVQHGHWAQDVAYHIGAALDVEDRRAHERDLLAHYFDVRERLGAPVPDRETGWRHYGAAMLYGYYLWAITRRVQQDITHEFVRRLGIGVADHDSFALVGA